MVKAGKHIISIAPGIGKYRGHILLPEIGLQIYLNPVERTLLCLFMAHPEGILADIQYAQEKEDKLDKAFELIWDDDQAQYVPFYISPLWGAIYKAFNIMFGLEDIEGVGNELSWWFEMAPDNKAIIGIDDEEINVSDVDAFYDYLVEESHHRQTDEAKEP